MVHSNNIDKKKTPVSKTYFPASFCITLLTALILHSQAYADDYTQWKYWTKVTVNTTVISGLTGSVSNFPLLVRLTSSNFDFTKAKAGGADIRFSNSADTHLSYEIERWDDASRLADIWVLVDNIVNSNNTQYIKMYWGNAAAADSSKPADVFRTTNNFAAAWHLNENPTGGSGCIKDRTSNANNGTPGGNMTTGDLVAGMIGLGLDFDSADFDYINAGSGSSLDNISNLTVSAWIRPKGWGGNQYGRIVSKSDDNLAGFTFMLCNNNATFGLETCGFMRERISLDTSDARPANNSLTLNTWTHLVMVMGSSVSRVYINGSEPSSYLRQRTGTSTLLSDAASNLYIGNSSSITAANRRPFAGIIDEVQISSTMRSADWIKLCYETQKTGQIVDSVKTPTMPIFSTHPVSDTAKVTQPASFNAQANGNPAPAHQWLKRQGAGAWTNVPGATGTTYSISSVVLSDSGNYRCFASNTMGKDSSNIAVLFVYDTFSITTHPVNVTAAVGGTANFSVTATGLTTKYQWYRRVGTGGTPALITGATSAVYSFTVQAGDTGTYYRCVVSSGPENLNSNFGMLVVGSGPNVPPQFPDDTVIAVGRNLTLTGTATGSPPLTLEWFFKHPSAPSPVSKGTGNTLQLTSMAKPDSGRYYFTAANPYGSRNSDTLFVHVLSPVTINPNLPPVTTAEHGGQASFAIGAAGDGQIGYQWYRNGSVIPGQTNNSYTLSPVDSAIHNGNTFYCAATNRHPTLTSMIVSTANSVVCTLKVSKLYNPFKVKVERVDIHNTTQVRMKLYSDVNISTFPSTSNPVLPWADSVWVMYKTSGYATDPSQAKVQRFFINDIKSAAPDSLKSIITVGALPMPIDSFYYFNYSVRWHVPTKPDTLLKPYINSDKVLMLDTAASPNPLIVHGEYIMGTDTALIIIDNITGLSAAADSLVVLQCSKYQNFTPLMLDDSLSVSQLLASGNKDTIIMDNLGTLPLEKDTVYCRWYVIARNATLSQVLDTTFTIGWDRPVYTGTLNAETVDTAGRIHLSWTAPQTGTDSVRIWWNTSPVPLIHNPPLPIVQAFYPKSPTVTIDTVKNLNNNTLYYFGLQILKDDFWSKITVQSSDSARTALGDTTIPPNKIKIDSTRFDTTRNSMVLYWHIKLATMPSGKTYKSGVTHTLESLINPNNKPISFIPINQDNNSTEIVLYPDITFDTSYTVGLWVQAIGPLGSSDPAKPTDTSTAKVAIPSFTWQEVKFFPDSNVVCAANKKIILKEITGFDHTDTARAYNPGSLPGGFLSVGGVSFNFVKNNPSEVKPFMLGLKYGSLPSGVTVADLGLYQMKSGQMYVLHGYTIADGAVWAEVQAADFAYPFLVLADIVKPVIDPKEYNDTVPAGTNIPSYFAVIDNIANAHWTFKYGRGDTAYSFSEEGYLNKSNDTASKLIFIDNSVISDLYGVRAIIVASDGAHAETLNVSKCVRNKPGEKFGIPPKKWVPLRTAAGLENRSLEFIFDGSVSDPDPWKYDIYKCRLYRWYNTNTSGPNAWLEYAEAVKSVFEFVPGKLIWCQMADTQTISLGQNVTTSLKKPYEIELKAMDWTDISTPYQFPIRLKDVLLATAPNNDSLVVCRWMKDGLSYSGEYLYNSFKDIVDTVSSILQCSQLNDGYTIYNHSSSPVTLKIPPVCLALSNRSRENISLAKKKSPDMWEVNLRWREAGVSEGYFKRVICSYNKSNAEDFYGPLPPTMSKVKAGVYDNRKKSVYGWALKTGVDRNGGLAYEIAFENNTSSGKKIEYYLESSGDLPGGIKARVYNANGGGYEECTGDNVSTLDLNSNGSTVRVIAVGPDSYFDHIGGGFLPVRLMKTYPNPFKGSVRVQYRIPFGIKEVAFTVYSIQGKVLWHGVDCINVNAGEHAYTMGLGKDIVPAGVYVIRLTAKDVLGKTIYGGEKRVTCIK